MPRYSAFRPDRAEMLEMLGRYYERVDAELRDRGLMPLLPKAVEDVEDESVHYDPLKKVLPEESWKPFAPPEDQEKAMVVDAIVEVSGIFNPWDLLYRTEIPAIERERRGLLPAPPLNE